MTLEFAGTILARLCFTLPVLYIGLSMALDPRTFVISIEQLAFAVRTLENRILGIQWPETIPQAESSPASWMAMSVLRLAGGFLVVCAYLPLADMLVSG